MRSRSIALYFNTRQDVVDVFSQQQRSKIMAKIKSRENRSTELRLIQIFKEFKIRGWRRRMAVFGNPDFVFPKARLAVFVDGCFWHSCPVHGGIPASNRPFWQRKFERNRTRDRLVGRELRKAGWVVLRIWQHELKSQKVVACRVQRSLTQSLIRLGDASNRAERIETQPRSMSAIRKPHRA